MEEKEGNKFIYLSWLTIVQGEIWVFQGEILVRLEIFKNLELY